MCRGNVCLSSQTIDGLSSASWDGLACHRFSLNVPPVIASWRHVVFQPPFNRLTYRRVSDGTAPDEAFFSVNASNGAVSVSRDLTTDNLDFYNVSTLQFGLICTHDLMTSWLKVVFCCSLKWSSRMVVTLPALTLRAFRSKSSETFTDQPSTRHATTSPSSRPHSLMTSLERFSQVTLMSRRHTTPSRTPSRRTSTRAFTSSSTLRPTPETSDSSVHLSQIRNASATGG